MKIVLILSEKKLKLRQRPKGLLLTYHMLHVGSAFGSTQRVVKFNDFFDLGCSHPRRAARFSDKYHQQTEQ